MKYLDTSMGIRSQNQSKLWKVIAMVCSAVVCVCTHIEADVFSA
jgi:hypothetical protein